MSTMSKQDRQGARTAADIERKYNFGKRFAEIMGIAEDAQEVAEEAKQAVDELDHDEIFKRLTDNGAIQGVFRGDDGQIYINAEYIASLSKLFAKDIAMTGKFTNTVNVFIEPGQEELEALQEIILSGVTPTSAQLALYDFNGDGKLTSSDLLVGQKAMLGADSLADWSGAVKTSVTLVINLKNPEKAISISGKNMWGRDVSGYIGVSGTTFNHRATVDYVKECTKKTYGTAKWDYRVWRQGMYEHVAKRKFFDANNPDVLAYAADLMNGGFNGITHIQLGAGSDAPATVCMGEIISNGSNRCNVVIYGNGAIYTNLNRNGTWQGWYKHAGTAV